MSRIGCIWMPHWVAQLEQRRRPNPRQPLIVRQEGVVLDASAQVAQRGVAPGDPLAQALARAPDALLVAADLPHYRQAWEEAVATLSLHSPAVEEEGWGLAYVEAAGLGALYGSEAAWCQALRHDLQERPGVQALIGVAAGKFTARVAAEGSPPWRGFTLVEGRDAVFLAPLTLDLLDLKDETRRRLQVLGIATLGALARLPANAVVEQFGPECLPLHRWAAGRDERPLQGRRRQALAVAHAFELPEARQEALLYVLQALGRSLLEELAESWLGARQLQARFELAGGQVWCKTIWAHEGLGPTMLRGLLEAALRELQHAGLEGEGVAAIELQLTGIEPPGGRQLQLFTQMEDRYRLAETLGKLAKRHAADSVVQAQAHLTTDDIIAARYRLQALG
jgi:nucleotidyltransferase/DNA polymerase involved in DNA repair